MRTVLVYVPSLYRLGPAAALMAGLPLFAASGIDVHLATDEIADENDLAAGLEVPVHRCRQHRGDRLWKFRLRKMARELRADSLHNWCGPASVDWAWTGIRARRFATVETVNQGAQLLNGRIARPELLVLQDETAELEIPGKFRVGQVSVPCMQTHASVLESATDVQARSNYFHSHFGIPEGSIVAVAAATLEPWTRVKDLIWATDLLCCVRDDFHLVIAGTGSQRKKLEHFSRLTETEGHIHFHGSPVDPAMMIRSADIFWQSSPAVSGRYAMLTAMFAGVPVIAAGGRICGGILMHQQTGLLVPPGSRDGFARWSKYLVELPAQREKLVKQAKSLVKHMDHTNSQLKRLAECYAG